MKKFEKQKNFFIFLTVIVVVILLIGGSVFFLIKTKTDKNDLNSQTTSPNSQSWLKILINNLESKPLTNPPSSINQCIYEEKTVYYLKPQCCDIQGVVYNYNGKIICHPDGGLSGRGDGLCPNFFKTSKNCSIIWKDSKK